MSTIQIATMHASKIKNYKIIHTPPRSKYHPQTYELLLCVPEQPTEATLTYLHHHRQWDALDCCHSFQNGPCCPQMICSAPVPYHRSIALAINRSGDVEQMNFSSWSSSCSFRIAGATPNATLGNATSTSRAISSISLKWCQYTI